MVAHQLVVQHAFPSFFRRPTAVFRFIASIRILKCSNSASSSDNKSRILFHGLALAVVGKNIIMTPWRLLDASAWASPYNYAITRHYAPQGFIPVAGGKMPPLHTSPLNRFFNCRAQHQLS